MRRILLLLTTLAVLLSVPPAHLVQELKAQNTALNRTTAVLMTNKSGGAVTMGAVVILDNTNATSFTTTTTAGLSTRGIGVVLEPSGIANNASGMVAIGGWVSRINLNTASTIGQFIKSHTVAGQGTPHSSPQVEGDFAVALTASANPAAMLFGSANPPDGGGTPGGSNTQVQYNNSGAFGGITGATTNGTTLTLVAPVLGTPASGTATNLTGLPLTGLVAASDDQTIVSSGSAFVAKTLPSCTDTGGNHLNYDQSTNTFSCGTSGSGSAGALMFLEKHAASSSASLDFTTCITSTYDDYLIRLINIVPATNGVNFLMRLSTNGGSSYDSTAIYDYGGGFLYSGGTGGLGATNQTSWVISGGSGNVSNSANYGVHGNLNLVDPARTSGYKQMLRTTGFFDSGVSLVVANPFTYAYKSTTAVNAFQFFMSSGNIASGEIRCYGIAKSDGGWLILIVMVLRRRRVVDTKQRAA